MAGETNSMAMVLLAHGARDARWGKPFLDVLEQVRAGAPDLAVELAYLEHLAPSLPDAVVRHWRGRQQAEAFPAAAAPTSPRRRACGLY